MKQRAILWAKPIRAVIWLTALGATACEVFGDDQKATPGFALACFLLLLLIADKVDIWNN